MLVLERSVIDMPVKVLGVPSSLDFVRHRHCLYKAWFTYWCNLELRDFSHIVFIIDAIPKEISEIA